MKTIEIEQMAVLWRNAPCSPAFTHGDFWDFFEKIGGRASILYGLWKGTPVRQRWKRMDYGLNIADALEAEVARATARDGKEPHGYRFELRRKMESA